MKPKSVIAVALLFVGVSLQLAGCRGLVAYPIKDSGIFAEDADLVWLDNNRVLFHGYKRVEAPIDPHKLHRFIDRALYLWNTTTGSLEVYDTFDRRPDGIEVRSTLCVHDGVLTYVNRGLVLRGGKGRETKTPFPKQPYWYNPFSCQYYQTEPSWIVDGHQTIPLLEEHGYLDLGTRPEADYLTLRLENPNPAIKFYSAESKNKFSLPIGWLESRILQVRYAPFSNSYLLSGLQYYEQEQGFMSDWPRETPHKVWWVNPDGRVQKEVLPNAAPLQGGWPGVFPVLNGLLVVSGNTTNVSEARAAGGYFVQGRNIQMVVRGVLRRVAVSPDGCSIAAINDTYLSQKPVSERMRLQTVELCHGE